MKTPCPKCKLLTEITIISAVPGGYKAVGTCKMPDDPEEAKRWRELHPVTRIDFEVIV